MFHRARAAAAVTCLLFCAAASDAHAARRTPRRPHVAPALSPAGSGPSLGYPHALAVDPAGGLIVGDRLTEYVVSHESAVLRIAPDGSRTILSDRAHGSGTGGSVGTGAQIFVQPSGQILYGMVEIDPVTGDRLKVQTTGPPYGFNTETSSLPTADAIFFGGSAALLRHDRATQAYELVSGCLYAIPCPAPRGSGPAFTFVDVIVQAEPGTLIVADLRTVFRVDVATGDRAVLSGVGRGSGPAMNQISGVVVEPAGTLLVALPGSILRIDPATGDRTVVSDATRGSGPALRFVEALVLEPAGTVAIADSSLGAIVRVDPASGDRSLISGGPIGAGPRPRCAASAAREASGSLVLADCAGGILRVDPETGDRQVVSDAVTGVGPLLTSAIDVAVEAAGTLLVVDDDSVKRVDALTGDRTVLARSGRRGGFRAPHALVIESPDSIILGDDGIEKYLPFPPPYGWYLRSRSGLFRVSLANGRQTLLSGDGFFSARRGEGAGFTEGVPFLAWLSPTAVAASVNGQLFRVDLVTGDRTLVSGFNRGAGPELTGPADVALDASGAWLVLESYRPTLWRVDPATGDRSVLSGAERGSGPFFYNPSAVVVEPDGAILVVNPAYEGPQHPYAYPTLMRVDPATGDRTVLSRH